MSSSATTTSEAAQREVEDLLEDLLCDPAIPSFLRNKHQRFVANNLSVLPERIQGLHCSQPWLIYWTLHAGDLLGMVPNMLARVGSAAVVDFLMTCFVYEDEEEDAGCAKGGGGGDSPSPRRGAFAGGPGQLPHMATTYAAVCAMCILHDTAALLRIDRDAISRWFASMRVDDHGFRMHRGGESDVRASYCVAVVSTLLQLPKREVFLSDECADFVVRCQTSEGGIACSPSSTEAHGGYTQCGMAALLLMSPGGYASLDRSSLGRWLANRQLQFEGGFNGRTNKLVDSCYSHWIGSSHALHRVGDALLRALSLPGWSASSADSASSSHKGSSMLSTTDIVLLDWAQLLDADTLSLDENTAAQFESSAMEARALHDLTEAFLASSVGAKADEAADSDFADICFLDEEVGDFLFNQRKLQDYVFRCCQHRVNGGLMDKPNHPNDYYHTCYAMSGTSVAQNLHFVELCRDVKKPLTTVDASSLKPFKWLAVEQRWVAAAVTDPLHGAVLGIDGSDKSVSGSADKLSILRVNNPIFNLCRDKVWFALRTFGAKSILL